MKGLGRHKFAAVCAGAVVVIIAAACSSPKPAPIAPVAPPLWGDMKPVVSVKELMRDMLDPLADNMFDAVGPVITERASKRGRRRPRPTGTRFASAR